MGGNKYCIGDPIRLTTDADARSGKVLVVDGVLVVVAWASGGTTEFSARVLERLTNEPVGDNQRQNPYATRRGMGRMWRDPLGRDHAV